MKPAKRCVLLFARRPHQEGRVKGLASAEPLFACVLDRIAEFTRELAGVDLVVIGEEGRESDQSSSTQIRICSSRDRSRPLGARSVAQRGGTFGERFENAFEDVRALGYEEIVAIGGDVPGLDGRRIAEAFDALTLTDVVLGPSPDGGVYLIGVRGSIGSLFAGVRWKTSSVFGRLLGNTRQAAVLDPLRDIDRRADLLAIACDPSLDPQIADLLRRILACSAVSARAPAPVPAASIVSSASSPRAPPIASVPF